MILDTSQKRNAFLFTSATSKTFVFLSEKSDVNAATSKLGLLDFDVNSRLLGLGFRTPCDFVYLNFVLEKPYQRTLSCSYNPATVNYVS